jgi:hypothetical protein
VRKKKEIEDGWNEVIESDGKRMCNLIYKVESLEREN